MRRRQGDHAVRHAPVVPERWHWPMSAAEVAAEVAAADEVGADPTPRAEHTCSEHDLADALRELAAEPAE